MFIFLAKNYRYNLIYLTLGWFSLLPDVMQLPKVTSQEKTLTTSTSPITSAQACPSEIGKKRIICYMASWSQYVPGLGRFVPENIDPLLCTHIIYANAHLNNQTYLLEFSDPWADIGQSTVLRFTNIKKLNPNVKVMLALGGWGDSASSKYSELIADPTKRSKFNDHAKTLLDLHKFDGLDLHWEYPGFPQGGELKNAADRGNFALWVAELKTVFGCKLLSSIVSPYPGIAEGAYDPSIYEHLDWVGVRTFNYHGSWFNYTWYTAPLYSDSQVTVSCDASIQHYIRQGCPPEKLMFGISTYGRTFTLDDPKLNGIDAPAHNPGIAGAYTRERGLLAYYEIAEQNWTVITSKNFGPYGYRDNQWVTFDNPEMVKIKAKYVEESGLGGIIFYTIDMDRFQSQNGAMYGPFDLIKTARNVLLPPVTEISKGAVAITMRNQTGLVLGISIPLSLITLLACVGIVVGLIIYKRNIRSLKNQLRALTKTEIEEFHYGNHNLDPNDINAPIHAAPFDKKYELTDAQLVVVNSKILGSGQYGLVVMGSVVSANSNPQYANESLQVAVKTVKPDVDVMYFKALLSEIKIMAYLGKHDHVASLIGARTDRIKCREIFVAIEFCAKGDLLGVLKKSRSTFENLLNANSGYSDNDTKNAHNRNEEISLEEAHSIELLSLGKTDTKVSTTRAGDEPIEERISTVNLIEWARQISTGMAYLSSKKVIHGDLAARNILITSESVAKISDFGLSRQLLNYSNYTKTTTAPLPWRWMAIESLKEMNFSVQSDAWSFGVVMWEIFTLGELPYVGLNWDTEFVNKLCVEGLRLHSPQYADKQIYDLMLGCWMLEPSKRISMEQMSNRLQEIILILTSSNGGSYELCTV